MEITYKDIKSLIIKEEIISGNQIQLEFCAKNQEKPFSTVAVIIPEKKDIITNVAKQMAKNTIKNVFLNLIGRFFGGIGGNIIRKTSNELLKNKNSGIPETKLSSQKKEEAIVEAFKNISGMYKYNELNSEWEYNMLQN